MPAATMSVRVNRIKHEAVNIKSFELVDPDGGRLPDFAPGSHIDVHVMPDIIRQYSLCNGPGDRNTYQIAVKKEETSRGGSSGMHEHVKEGDLITISQPRNNFPIAWAAKHHLLLAGGIGVTPLLGMARHLGAAGASFTLHYFARSEVYIGFREVLSSPGFAQHIVFHYGFGPDEMQSYLHDLLHDRPEEAHLYMCGPRPFMNVVASAAAPAWAPDAIHLEYFSAAPGLPAEAQRSFRVKLARSGHTYTIPADKTIVQVLVEHGIHIDVSCQQGVCGTCLTKVVEGTPDHRDEILGDAARQACNIMAPCVSRAVSDTLVLDL
jgi:vanillate O-demethylase ferredoxin subunit